MKFARLGDVAKMQVGYAFSSTGYVTDEIPIIRIGNLSEGLVELDYNICWPEEFLSNNREYEIKKGDILLAMSGTTAGKAARYTHSRPALLNQRVCRLINNPALVDQDYLFYALNSEGFVKQVSTAAYGCAQPNISLSRLAAVPVPLPPVPVQKQIIEMLDTYTVLVCKRNEQINLCDKLIDSLFSEMFGNPGQNDKNWYRCGIGSECSVKGGKRLPEGTEYTLKADYPYLRAADLKDYSVCRDNIAYLPENVREKLRNYTISKEDVYLTTVGVNLGMPGTIPEDLDGANLTENAVKLVIKDKTRLNKVFLARYLGSPYAQELINGRKMTAGVPKLAIFRIEQMELLLPPISLQESFAIQTDKILEQKSIMSASLKKMKQNITGILDDLYNR